MRHKLPGSVWPTRQFLAGIVAGMSAGLVTGVASGATGTWDRTAWRIVLPMCFLVSSIACGYARWDQWRARPGAVAEVRRV
jgi:hypothetical protein